MATLRDEYIQRTTRLIRVADGEAIKVADELKKIHVKLMTQIAGRYEGISTAKLRDLNRIVEDLIIEYYRDNVAMSTQDMAAEITKRELEWGRAAMSRYTAFKSTRPIIADAVKRAMVKPFQGATFPHWFKQAGITNASRVMKSLTNAWAQGMSAAEALRQVFNITQRAEADLKTLTRSFFMHMSMEARDVSLQAFEEVIGGYVWDSILDNRTTVICGVRDQLRYDTNHNPIGHDIPWGAGPGRIHFNCRSNYVPFLKGESPEAVDRAAVEPGPEYEQGDKTTRSGKIRKPTKVHRDSGKLEINMVTTRTKYEGWLRRQPIAFVADSLGSLDKAREFKAGAALRTFLPDSGPGSIGVVNNISMKNL